jgi:2-haloacid dehalogenase
MPKNRRDFIKLAAAAAAIGRVGSALAATRTRALAFDAFPIFNPTSIAEVAEHAFPGKGRQLMEAWTRRQFEYTWLRGLGQRYADFWTVTTQSLVYAAKVTELTLTGAQRDTLLGAYLELKAWPDVLPALKQLRAADIKLGFLSNFTRKMLDDGIKSAGLQGMFDHVISTDVAATYKPDPRAYQLGVDTFKLKREEIVFVPFAAWDAAGAQWFGYRTLWVNRAKQHAEELEMNTDGMVSSLTELVPLVKCATGTVEPPC